MKCGILFNYPNDMVDTTGCLKEDCHESEGHIFRNDYGKLIYWQDDYECNCGCWDEYLEGDEIVCGIYHEVTEIQQ
tara:strand:+ start:1707 stop:1934 length:228 start_codon:yes stop_codon:yes gene_type:complete